MLGYSYMPVLLLKRGGCRSTAGGQYDAGSSCRHSRHASLVGWGEP